MTHRSTSSTLTTPTTSKKGRRFSLIRLFSNTSSTSSGSLSPSNIDGTYQRHSIDPSSNSLDSMRKEMMRERRKSIAAVTESSFRSKSFDLRPSAIRPILSRKEAPQIEMTEKMRQFDELLHTRKTSTIRITLTPSLLQEP
ncbi:hypothetical protein BGX21_006977 [Mortierella sp. AD011]|nr:hypothetical protein BGX20_002965 [Mortierella sp. AD010]KAF9403118.1 hypothetical protein BGX21_006977 [Mortierella sp. AD011]